MNQEIKETIKEYIFKPLTDGERQLIDKNIQENFAIPAQEYNEYGLKFNMDELNRIGANVIMLPIEYMAKYVDIITKTNIDENNPDFLESQFHDFKVSKENYKSCNATSCGNIAYIYLHCKDEKVKQICKQAIFDLLEIHLEFVQTHLKL